MDRICKLGVAGDVELRADPLEVPRVAGPAEGLAGVGVWLPVCLFGGRLVQVQARVVDVDLDSAAGDGRPVAGPLALVAHRLLGLGGCD